MPWSVAWMGGDWWNHAVEFRDGAGPDPRPEIIAWTTLLGAVAGLVAIPIGIAGRMAVIRKRQDLSTDRVSILFERMLYMKGGLDAFLGVLLILGLFVHDSGNACKAIGFLYQFEETCTLILIFRIAMHPFKFMVQKEDMNATEVYFKQTVVQMVGGALLVAVPLAAANQYGHAYPLCWLSSVKTQFYAFFSMVFLVWYVGLTSMGRVIWTIQHRRRSRSKIVYHGNFFVANAHLCVGNFAVLIFVLIYSYIFRIISRGYELLYGKPTTLLVLLEIITIAFRGATDALVYSPKDWMVWVKRKVLRRSSARAPPNESESLKLTLLGRAYPIDGFVELPPSKTEDKKIFVTTYNMGECRGQAMAPLSTWIPLGMSLYVIGVQECMNSEALGKALLEHVGGPELYVSYHREIGSTQTVFGYHGMIALWVLARVEDVRGHHFLLHEAKRNDVARGRNLGVTVAQNKGGIGLAFRYHDTTFAVVSCHLSSDLKGRSRVRKRMRDARELLRHTNLWREDYKVDLVYQHHAVIFLGDLNFRMNASVPSVLASVAKLAKREKQALGEEWRALRYAEILDGGLMTLRRQALMRRAASLVAFKESVAEGEEIKLEDIDLDDARWYEAEDGFPGVRVEDEGDDDEEDYDEDYDEDDARMASRPGPVLTRSWQQISFKVKRLLTPPREDELLDEDEEAGLVRGSLQSSKRGSFRIPLSSFQSTITSPVLSLKEGDDDDDDDDDEASIGGQPAGLPPASWAVPGSMDGGKESGAVSYEQRPLPPVLGHVSEEASSLLGNTFKAESWEDLLQRDELWNAMRAGDCFFGFKEAPIRFPPSYRRIKGAKGQCGDYSDLDVLYGAFSHAVAEKRRAIDFSRITSSHPTRALTSTSQHEPSLANQPSSAYPSGGSFHPALPSMRPRATTTQSGTSSMPTTSTMMQGQPSLAGDGHVRHGSYINGISHAEDGNGNGGSGSTTTRVPSYTDRILVHTFPDMGERITIGPYELCDAQMGSDHRPVSTVLTARVRTEIRGVQNFQISRTGLEGRGVATVHDAAIMQLSLSNLSVLLDEEVPLPSLLGSVSTRRSRSYSQPTGSCIRNRRGSSKPTSRQNSMKRLDPFRPPPGSTVIILFPLENEDVFSALRRPLTVVEVAKSFSFLTSETELNPFRFFCTKTYEEAEKNGLLTVSCVRPEYGLHAFLRINGPDDACLGQCVLALCDEAGRPLASQLRQDVPLTDGGTLTGYLRCDIHVKQLTLSPSSVT